MGDSEAIEADSDVTPRTPFHRKLPSETIFQIKQLIHYKWSPTSK